MFSRTINLFPRKLFLSVIDLRECSLHWSSLRKIPCFRCLLAKEGSPKNNYALEKKDFTFMNISCFAWLISLVYGVVMTKKSIFGFFVSLRANYRNDLRSKIRSRNVPTVAIHFFKNLHETPGYENILGCQKVHRLSAWNSINQNFTLSWGFKE